MSLAELPVFAAIGLGVLTSVSPCPMANHAAAIAVLVRQAGSFRRGLAVGAAYASGRATTYALVAWIGSEGLLRLGPIVRKIQAHADTALGVAFFVGGLLLAISPWLRFGLGLDASGWKTRLDRLGAVPGAFGLGMILALAFCPVSAGIFFGSVIPLALATTPSWSVTVAYGLATALPVFVLTLAAGSGTRQIARVFRATQFVAPWLHWVSVVGMMGTGIWFLAKAWG